MQNQNTSWRMRNRILWEFDIQTDHLIPTKRPDLAITKKKGKEKVKRESAVQWVSLSWRTTE